MSEALAPQSGRVPDPMPAGARALGTSPIALRPLSPGVGAEILGVDLAAPLDEATFEAIRAAWYAHCVILLRGQRLSEHDHVRFATRFGALGQVVNKHEGASRHLPGVMFVSNVLEDGRLIGALPDGEMMFHSDQCYVEKPCIASLLYAIEIPSRGGNTLFANMYAAYEALPDALKTRLEGMRALNVYDYDGHPTQRPGGETAIAANAPRWAHPVVRTHPATGRKALYVNRLMTRAIVGMDAAESDRILAFLFDHAENPAWIYEHRWRVGDLVMWDNRCTLHARTDFDASERRLLRRSVVVGEAPR